MLVRALHALSIVTPLILLIGYPAWAQSIEAVLFLEPLPSELESGETIIFSGILTTSDGAYVVPNRTIYIKDDVAFGADTFIGSIVTDDAGEYSASWVAEPRNGGGSYDFYAVFEGDGYVSSARSVTYSVLVHGSDDNGQSPSPGYQNYYPSTIELFPAPSSVYAGESITFIGTLESDGEPIANALIKIMEDDPLMSDQLLSSGFTNTNGAFSVSWQVTKDSLETDFDIYATFDGDSNYLYARSANQVVSVLRFTGSISLDPIPSKANVGDILTFEGALELSQGSSEGAIVYVKDEDPLNPDDLLATAYVNKDGTFSTNWFVTEADADGVVDIYAVFEGNDVYYRLTTCDPNPTMEYGGTCEFTIPLEIFDITEPSPDDKSTYSSDEYMDLFYSIDFSDTPHVTIVPTPDSYDSAYKYVGATEEGILMWTSYMEQEYGGNWNVEFEVVARDDLFFDSKPDIIVNLVTPEVESGCNSDFAGVAYIKSIPVRPVQTKVCVISGGSARSTGDVSATAAHEFIHAVGLGHAWNREGDLMCSSETDDTGSNIWTCPNSWLGKSKTPSVLNIAAVAKLYGGDGFMEPNANVSYKSKFYLGQVTDESTEGPDESPSIGTGSQPGDNRPIHVKSSMSNGYVDHYQVDPSLAILKMLVKTSTNDGELTITLPRNLIDSTSFDGNDDQAFVVFVDGREAYFSETNTNPEERTLVIQIPRDSSEVEILGTEIGAVQVVPEFPMLILIVPLAMIPLVLLARLNKLQF